VNIPCTASSDYYTLYYDDKPGGEIDRVREKFNKKHGYYPSIVLVHREFDLGERKDARKHKSVLLRHFMAGPIRSKL
jgi:hypothetical protein